MITAEQYTNKDLMISLAPENRASLQQLISGWNRKVDSSDKFIINYQKSLLPEGGEASYEFIMKELAGKLGRMPTKSLAVEEKLYIGYHLSLIKGCVGKMMELTIARKSLEGKGKYHSGGDFRGGRDDRNRNRYGGGRNRGRFDHRGSY